MKAPIKTCDYCDATGEMPTFMNGETICYTCMSVLPKTLPEARQELMRLRAVLAVGAQPAANFADAYQGAMEEVAVWKKRALEAEDLNRKFIAGINGPTYMGEPAQPAPSVPDEEAAYNGWFRVQQGVAYDGMWTFARAAWMARAKLAAAPEVKP